MKKRILGIDPGSRIAGFGVLEYSAEGDIFHIAHGALDVRSSVSSSARSSVSSSARSSGCTTESDFHQRLYLLGLGFREVLEKYKPDAVAIENIFLGKNADSAFKLGHARGVITYEMLLKKLLVFEYSTRLIKKTVTGSGGAEKEQVQDVLKMLLKISSFTHLDASDAVAVAYHHAVTEIAKARRHRGLEI